MKQKRTYFILALVIVVFLALVALRILADKGDPTTRRLNVPLVRIELPKRETVINKLEFTGNVVAIQQANIFSKVTGNLEKVFVDIGSRVRRNQLLCVIDSTELYQQMQQALATYTNARVTYQRTNDLLKQNLVAKQDRDNAEAQMKVAKANYDNAVTRLSYARITAPFSGFITKRYLDPGALVTTNNSTLFSLMDLDSVKVDIDILEKDVPLVSAGKRADIEVDAMPGKIYSGAVSRMSQAVDLSTRTMAVEINIPNPDLVLKPGMFATVTLIVAEHPNSITVPTYAVMSDDSGAYVFVAANSVARRVRISAGLEQDARTEVLKGLTGGESVITTGQQFVRDGGSIIVQP